MKPEPSSLLAPPAQLAKAALRALASQQLEPTPDNFARAYAQQAGTAAPTATARAAAPAAWAQLIERIARGLDRGGRHWTAARKKQSLQRVLDGSRHDAARLQSRLERLLAAWDGDRADSEVEASASMPLDDAPSTALGGVDDAAADRAAPSPAPAAPGELVAPSPGDSAQWSRVVDDYQATVEAALPASARELADALARCAERIAGTGPDAALLDEVAALSERARRVLTHNRHLADELALLCRALTASLGELAEDESWARGQIDAMHERLGDGVSARGVRAAADLLDATRARQRELKREREAARDALKQMFQRMLTELGELGSHTGRFNDQLQRHADTVARAESLQDLAGVVQEMVGQARAVHQVVSGARERLTSEHARAVQLEQRVRDLESELRRLADEVSTDALTQVANRRGLTQAFAAEVARNGDGGAPLAIALIDIDNFKKLNDSLGHAAGDVALKALAARVRESLRPGDQVARFGGEEFVVLLPGTPLEAAREALTRLQRRLSASLFMHDGREVFVTFSAGVTCHRGGESLDAALERADQALYEAKRTGKNRTCTA